MATYYWVGGTGTWNTSTTTNWALTSGGTGGLAGPPTSADDVIIDTSSGTGTITCTAGVCNNLTVTASQAIILGALNSTLSVYGNLSFPSGGSFSADTNGAFTITFRATSTGKTITSNGKGYRVITFNGVGGGWTLQDALSLSNTFTLTNGSFNANNFNVTCDNVSSSNSNTRTLTMGSGTWTLSGTGTIWTTTITTGLTFNANTSTIALSDTSTTAKTFNGGGLTYYNLSITGATGVATYTITGANTFNQILSSKTVAYTITLQASTTTTVTTWSATGSLNNLLTLNSSLSGTAATLAATNAFTVNYGIIQDVNMSAALKGTATSSTLINSNNWQVATTSSRWLTPLVTVGSSTVTTPSDWPTTAVTDIYVIGGGGGGAGNVTNTIAGGAGGGGGGYAKLTNTSLAASTSYPYTVGNNGNASVGGTTTQTGGTGGTSSFYKDSPVYVSSAASVQNTNSLTISVTVPSVSNGNLMVMILISRSVGSSWTTPSGWTASSASAGKAIFYKTASSEPASYTVTQSTSTTASAFIIAYSNATFDTAGAIGGNASPAQPAAITVAQSNSTIIYWVGRDSAVSTYTTPTGYTARQADSDATAPSTALFSLANRAAGSYTAPTSTPSFGTAAAVVIALSPTATVSATGGAGGVSTTTPSSTGGAGGVGSGGTTNYTGGTGGVGGTSGTIARTGGGGGGAAGPNGNGGNGGAGVNSSGTTQQAGSGSGGGSGGGTAGGAGTATTPNGAGGNNSLGTGGGTAVTTVNTAGNPGTLGGGGSGNVGTNAGGDAAAGGNGIDIISVLSEGSGGGGGGSSSATAAGAGGRYGGGGGGNGRPGTGNNAGGDGYKGAIFIGYTGTYSAGGTGNFFFLFM